MSTPAQSMRKALADYLTEVEATLTELSELESLSETFGQLLANNDRLNSEIEDAVRVMGNLQDQRTELFNDYHNATFEGDTERVAEIETERDEIDARVTELEQGIEDSRKNIVELDSTAVAELLAKLWDTKSPKFAYRYEYGRSIELVSTKYTGWSELVKELERADEELKNEILEINQSIERKAGWTRLADEATLREKAPELADYLFGTLAAR